MIRHPRELRYGKKSRATLYKDVLATHAASTELPSEAGEEGQGKRESRQPPPCAAHSGCSWRGRKRGLLRAACGSLERSGPQLPRAHRHEEAEGSLGLVLRKWRKVSLLSC